MTPLAQSVESGQRPPRNLAHSLGTNCARNRPNRGFSRLRTSGSGKRMKNPKAFFHRAFGLVFVGRSASASLGNPTRGLLLFLLLEHCFLDDFFLNVARHEIIA